MTTPPAGWPPVPPSYPPPQGDPAYPAAQGGRPPPQGAPSYPPPQGTPTYPPPQSHPGYPVPAEPLTYPPSASSAPQGHLQPPGGSGPFQEGWAPPPLGAAPTGWAPPGWPAPTAAPVTTAPQPPVLYAAPQAYPQQGFPPPGYAPSGFPPQAYPPQVFVPPPSPRRSRLLVWVSVVAALVALGAVGVLFLPQLLSPSQGDRTVEVSGGDVGKAIDLSGSDGSGTVTVTRARWTTEGEVAPEPGTRYLILDVTIEGVSGELTTGGVFTAVIAATGDRHGLSFGPVVDPLLVSRALAPGESNIGQLGYQLRPGDARVEFQTPDGVTLGSVQIPGP